jgi:hypothetical protein
MMIIILSFLEVLEPDFYFSEELKNKKAKSLVISLNPIKG